MPLTSSRRLFNERHRVASRSPNASVHKSSERTRACSWPPLFMKIEGEVERTYGTEPWTGAYFREGFYQPLERSSVRYLSLGNLKISRLRSLICFYASVCRSIRYLRKLLRFSVVTIFYYLFRYDIPEQSIRVEERSDLAWK